MNIIDAGLKFNSGHEVRSGDPNGIVLHHAAASSASVDTVHSGHKGNGWIGIGYHFYVRKDGSVYRGRPENWVGAHTYGHNSTKLGICAEGNFENESMPEAQKDAIIELLAYLFGKYGVLPVLKHKDLSVTACPGKNYPYDAIVSGAKNRKTETKTETTKEENTVNVTLNVLKKGSEGKQVKALQRMLFAMGYSLGTKNPCDGSFGAKTFSAVCAYQKDAGLTVDGIVGAKTWASLLGA